MSYDVEGFGIHGSTMVPSMEGTNGGALSAYDRTEGRLVEAMQTARRMPDRERGWLSVRAWWPSIVRERALGDYDARGYLGTTDDAPAPRVPLGRDEIARMEEAEAWLGLYLDGEARALVVAALGWLASGRRIGWRKLRVHLGASVGEAALAKRYMIAIATIACGLDGKGAASVQAMVRQRRAWQARDSALRSPSGAMGKGRRQRHRKVECVVHYAD